MTSPIAASPDPRLLFPALARGFAEHFGTGATPRVFFAPGRVNLMGAHLDYNGGPVLPTAVDRGTLILAAPRPGRRVRLACLREGEGLEVDLERLPMARTGAWSDYPLGVLREVLELARARGCLDRTGGLDLYFGGNLPVGAGLSSSASICVGTALALDRTWGLDLAPMDRVHAALRAERGFVGVQCGIMDPYAVGLARPEHLLWLDCKDAAYEHLPLDPTAFSIAVADSGVRRELAAGEFNRRVAECDQAFGRLAPHAPDAICLRDVPWDVFLEHRADLEPVLARRVEHVLREVERTFAARSALLAGDIVGFGRLIQAAHGSLRDLYEVSCRELDRIVEDALACSGVFGARLTGAGFGGCAVILVRKGAEEELAERLTRGFHATFGREVPLWFFRGDEGPRELEV